MNCRASWWVSNALCRLKDTPSMVGLKLSSKFSYWYILHTAIPPAAFASAYNLLDGCIRDRRCWLAGLKFVVHLSDCFSSLTRVAWVFLGAFVW